MDDNDQVALVAADYVRRYGQNALYRLRERESEAVDAGDDLSAQAWGDIAAAAMIILLHSN
jgi:hypothetical protein